MTRTHPALLVLMLLMATACEKVGKNEWSEIDYSRIARDNYNRQNDSNYTPPTVLGCVDDDLYNCNRRR